jgi:hypothetical protein
MTLTPVVPHSARAELVATAAVIPVVTAVPRPRRKGRASRAPASAGVERFVSCVFCHEGIPTSSFATVRSDPRLMSASCPNCALQVSGTQATWELWNRASSDAPERGRAETLRARRVATATRLLRERLAVTLPREV